jgi:DNA repair protein RadC
MMMSMEIKRFNRHKIHNSTKVAEILQTILNLANHVDRDKEHFFAIGLNSANSIIFIELVSLGILNTSLVHPREVFRFAILKGVAAIVVAHNHPSGNIIPSIQDKEITTKLVASGKILDIPVLDHVIITSDGHYSFSDEGLMD